MAGKLVCPSGRGSVPVFGQSPCEVPPGRRDLHGLSQLAESTQAADRDRIRWDSYLVKQSVPSHRRVLDHRLQVGLVCLQTGSRSERRLIGTSRIAFQRANEPGIGPGPHRSASRPHQRVGWPVRKKAPSSIRPQEADSIKTSFGTAERALTSPDRGGGGRWRCRAGCACRSWLDCNCQAQPCPTELGSSKPRQGRHSSHAA